MVLNLPRLSTPRAYFVHPQTGRPVSLGEVRFFAPGTTTAKAVFTDRDGETSAGNVVSLDAAGSCAVFLNGAYRVEVYDANGALLFTADYVNSIAVENEVGNPGSLIANQNLADLDDVPTARSVLGLVKPQSAGVAAIGEVMTVGTLGFGGPTPAYPGSPTDFNTMVLPGRWGVSSVAGMANPPTSDPGILEVEQRGADLVLHTYRTTSSVRGGRIFTRALTAGGWTRWGEFFGQASILGPVAQSGGVPTGALIEKGSNVRGVFRKYACGMMRQAAVVSVNLNTSSVQTFNLPVGFIASAWISGSLTPASVEGTGFAARLTALIRTSVAVSPTQWLLRVEGASVTPGSADVTLYAEGEWF